MTFRTPFRSVSMMRCLAQCRPPPYLERCGRHRVVLYGLYGDVWLYYHTALYGAVWLYGAGRQAGRGV